MKRYIFPALAIVLALSCVSATAAEELGDNSSTALFRGQFAPSYNVPHNGTFYWSSPEFKRGDVCFNGRVYHDVLMNVDAYSQNLIVQKSPSSVRIMPERSRVAWFVIEGKTYVNLNYSGIDDVPDGFFESFADNRGNLWYRQVRKPVFTEIGNFNGVSGIGYDDPKYRDEVLTFFYHQELYYSRDKKGRMKKYKPSKAARMDLKPVSGIEHSLRFSALEPMPVALSRAALKAATGPDVPLPTGYFSDDEMTASQKASLAALQQDNRIAEMRNKTYEVGIGGGTGTAVVKGRVCDVATGEPLSGVLVSNSDGSLFTYTASDGSYSLELPKGENILNLSDYSMEDMHVRIILRGNGGLDIVMREKVTALQSAYVSSETLSEHRRTTMGVEKISMKIVNKIPSAFGEGDILRAVMTLPGVKTVGEAASGFNVRGGSVDQNLIIFNEGTIYNPSHMFGIFSAFNTDVIDNVELYKSSIPVRYGGRISSVLDIKGKEGDSKRFRGSLGIGLLTSHAEIEGPIVKDRTTFVLGGRITYSDWMLKVLPKDSGYAGGGASFSDVNASVTHRFDKNNTLQAFGYWSRDRFTFSADTTFRYSNLNVALKYKHQYENRRTLTVSAGYDQYGNILDNYSNAANAYTLATTIRQGFVRGGWTHPLGEHHTLSYGFDAVYYALSPGTISPYSAGSLVAGKSLALEQAVQPDLYAGDLWQIGDSPFSLDCGVRMSSFLALAPAKYYGLPEFRLSGKYSPLPALSFKAGFNSMNQYIHLISNTAGISPMDTWQLSTADIKPQRGWQAAAGAYWSFGGGMWDLSLEGYYKKTNNYLDYKSGAVLQMNEHLADDLVTTYAKAYGGELMLKKISGKLTGWVSYTYSRALLKEMADRGVETINGGAWYPAAHDKPHDVKFVGNYAFTHRYSISVNLDYSTGRPVTIPVGQFYYEGARRFAYSERNGYRIPDYFRMDVAFNIDAGHYLKAFTHASATIGCYNVTGRKNAYSVYFSTNGGTQLKGYMMSVFATQIPYVSINLKF